MPFVWWGLRLRRLRPARSHARAGACANRPAVSAGRPANTCGYPVANSTSWPVGERELEAQLRLQAVLGGSPASVHGVVVTGPSWLAELSGLVRVLAEVAEPDQLAAISAPAAAAFADHDRRSPRRAISITTLSPPDPALLAAMEPIATELLARPTTAEFDEGLEPFFLRATSGRFPHLSQAHIQLGMRGLLLESWARLLRPRARLTNLLRSPLVGPPSPPRCSRPPTSGAVAGRL